MMTLLMGRDREGRLERTLAEALELEHRAAEVEGYGRERDAVPATAKSIADDRRRRIAGVDPLLLDLVEDRIAAEEHAQRGSYLLRVDVALTSHGVSDPDDPQAIARRVREIREQALERFHQAAGAQASDVHGRAAQGIRELERLLAD